MRSAMLTQDDIAEAEAVTERLRELDGELRNLWRRLDSRGDETRCNQVRLAQIELGRATGKVEAAFR